MCCCFAVSPAPALLIFTFISASAIFLIYRRSNIGRLLALYIPLILISAFTLLFYAYQHDIEPMKK